MHSGAFYVWGRLLIYSAFIRGFGWYDGISHAIILTANKMCDSFKTACRRIEKVCISKSIVEQRSRYDHKREYNPIVCVKQTSLKFSLFGVSVLLLIWHLQMLILMNRFMPTFVYSDESPISTSIRTSIWMVFNWNAPCNQAENLTIFFHVEFIPCTKYVWFLSHTHTTKTIMTRIKLWKCLGQF